MTWTVTCTLNSTVFAYIQSATSTFKEYAARLNPVTFWNVGLPYQFFQSTFINIPELIGHSLFLFLYSLKHFGAFSRYFPPYIEVRPDCTLLRI